MGRFNEFIKYPRDGHRKAEEELRDVALVFKEVL